MALIDTHCHLSHERFRDDLDAVLVRAAAAGVTRVVSIASHLEDAGGLVACAEAAGVGGAGERVPRIFTTAGVHPHEVGHLPGGHDGDAEVREVLERLRGLLAHPGVVAVGECGLDFHYDFAPRDAQFRWFERQLRVAEETGLPVVVHCREAEDDMVPRVREAGEAGVRGVLHCFPGHGGLLEAAMEAGWSISFTGIVTFRSFEGIDAVQRVPEGRYFLETDGPYLAPMPHRGKRNEPSFVPLIRDRVAELRGMLPSEVEESTTTAAVRFFDLPTD
ncbi:hypothetical protein BH23GEM11_BH23GEM11_20530 [soil metagenome]